MTEPQAGALLTQRGRRSLRVPLMIVAIPVLFALSLWLVHDIDQGFKAPLVHNDLIGRWLGTRAALHGQDPYSPAMTRQIQAIADHDKTTAFDYPATFAVLMAPLALLPWKTASVLYLVGVIPLLALAIWFCVRLVGPSLPWGATALITLAAIGSWPSMWGLRLWQPGMLTALCLFAGCYWLSRGGETAAGILFALAAIKPQFVLPLLLVLGIWTLLRRQWSFLLSFVATNIALLALAEMMVPGWIPHWIASLGDYQRLCGKMPLETLFGWTASRVVAAALGLGTLARLWSLRRAIVPGAGASKTAGLVDAATVETYGYVVALLLALPVAINTTTPLMIYNDLLLLPGCVLLCATRSRNDVGLAARRFAQIWLGWAFLCAPAAYAASALSHTPMIAEKMVFLNPLFGSAVTLFLLLNPPAGRIGDAVSTPDPTPQTT